MQNKEKIHMVLIKKVANSGCSTGIGISSNTSRLLSEYKKWKQIDKDYMAACGSEVDLLKTFSVTFSAFNTALKPVMKYLLNNNNVGTKLLYLREWGDSLQKQFKHDVPRVCHL